MAFDLLVKAPENSEYLSPAWHVRAVGQKESGAVNMVMGQTEVSHDMQKSATELIGQQCGSEFLELSVLVPKLVLSAEGSEVAEKGMTLLARAATATESDCVAQQRGACKSQSIAEDSGDAFVGPKGSLKHMRLALPAPKPTPKPPRS